MAITNSFAKFLFHIKKSGTDFNSVLTLGRLRLYTSADLLNKAAANLPGNVDFASTEGDDYSEKFFELLGSRKTDSMDYSAYEKATIIHDLNQNLPSALKQQYSVVIDSGTLEHVFNFPVAIKSCMDALKVGGTYIAITPANNMMGHGFYQFSPELFYRIFSAENGFNVQYMYLGVQDDSGEVVKWYDVKDPAVVQARVTLRNFRETYLFIAAVKEKQLDVLQASPYQSDYSTAWKNASDQEAREQPLLKKIYKASVPEKGQRYLSNLKNYILKSKKFTDEYIGVIDPRHFTEIDL